jgi:hypothetical protein
MAYQPTLYNHSRSGTNFTAYQEIKKFAHKMQPELTDLPSYQHMAIGLISGACGPLTNAPIDTIKTRTSIQVWGLFLSSWLFDARQITALSLGGRCFRRFAEE